MRLLPPGVAAVAASTLRKASGPPERGSSTLCGASHLWTVTEVTSEPYRSVCSGVHGLSLSLSAKQNVNSAGDPNTLRSDFAGIERVTFMIVRLIARPMVALA